MDLITENHHSLVFIKRVNGVVLFCYKWKWGDY